MNNLSLIIKNVLGKAFYLPGKNVDTDRIIPARFLQCVSFDGLGEHVFQDDRDEAEGKHPFDSFLNVGFDVLVVDENFACGSSREHAPIALKKWGIRAIIAKGDVEGKGGFAEIFRGNAAGNGMVCVTVTPEVHTIITDQIRNGGSTVTIDLETMHVEVGDSAPMSCHMSAVERDDFLRGTWQHITTCLLAEALINDAAARQPWGRVSKSALDNPAAA